MIQYVQKDVLTNLCNEQIEPNLGTLLVEVVASVLDNEVILSAISKKIVYYYHHYFDANEKRNFNYYFFIYLLLFCKLLK